MNMNTVKAFAVVTLGYLLIAFIGVLFIEGVLGGCDVGECILLPIR
jgi:hypothetical protein